MRTSQTLRLGFFSSFLFFFLSYLSNTTLSAGIVFPSTSPALNACKLHECVLSLLRGDGGGGGRERGLPWLSVEVLFMSPEMKEDSDCFLTVSFHIRLMRLCAGEKSSH